MFTKLLHQPVRQLLSAKKFLLCISIVFIAPISFSQISIGFGLRSHFGGMQAFKDVKQYYNDNRPWLDNELSSGAMMNGFEVGLEMTKENFGVSLMHFYYVGSKTKAKGVSNGIEYERTLKARMGGIEFFDCHWTPIHLGKVNVGFGVMPLGLSLFRAKTVLNDGEPYKPPFSYLEYYTQGNTGKAFHMHAQVHADVTIAELSDVSALHFQLFYTFGPLQEYDLYYLNRELNPSTSSAILKRTFMKINNFGAKLTLIIN